jgi:hypothetical protein
MVGLQGYKIGRMQGGIQSIGTTLNSSSDRASTGIGNIVQKTYFLTFITTNSRITKLLCDGKTLEDYSGSSLASIVASTILSIRPSQSFWVIYPAVAYLLHSWTLVALLQFLKIVDLATFVLDS